MRKQRTLKNVDDIIKNIPFKILNIDLDKINDIVYKNIFGYLPSNFSQLLYYLAKDWITKIFNINEQIIDIFSEVNDSDGWIKLFFKINDSKVYKIDLNSNNCNNLKSYTDFK